METKSLDDVIKGLDLCSGMTDQCDECPYKTPESVKGDLCCDEYEVPIMMSDALYYLTQYRDLKEKLDNGQM